MGNQFSVFDDEPEESPGSKFSAFDDAPPEPAPVVDMGPDARRARAGMPARSSYDPSELDPGLDLRDAPGDTSFFPSSKPFAPGSHEAQAAALNAQLPTQFREGVDPMQVDWGAQAIASGLVGHGAGTVAGNSLRALGVPAPLARVGGAAVEGGTASKAQGGSFAAGAALGGGLAAIRPLARAVAGGRNVVKDVTKGATKAPAKLTNEVKFRAGEGGDELTSVLAETPVARRAVMTKARTNPGAAADDLTGVIDEATDLNSADFAAIQRQHGGVPLKPVVDRLRGLAERLNLQGRGVSADAVERWVADLEKPKRYGMPGKKLTPEQMETTKISAQQLRNLRNDMGTVIDPARTIKPNTKRQAMAKIYGVMAKEIEDVAANTRGVDLAAMKLRNRRISHLIPVRDALAARAESQAEQGVGAKIRRLPGDAVRRVAREVDYAAGDLAGVPASVPVNAAQDRPAPVGVPAGFVAAMRGGSPGMTEPGNINLTNRPRVKNADGSISTVRSMGVNIDGVEVLIPTVSEDGRIMTDDEAVEQYKRTGRHLGKFSTPEASTAYAESLHNDQAKALGL